jgi:hypothetical protein
MTKRSLIALALVLAAAATQAHARAPAPLQDDPLPPRSDPTPTVAQSVARLQIEKAGYTSVRGLWRDADGAWHGVARNPNNAAVPVVVDDHGHVSEPVNLAP